MGFELLEGLASGLRPIARVTVSQWAEKYRYLSPMASAEPGLFRNERTPFNKEIMDKLSANDPTQEVIVMKGAQLGLTESGNNWIGYIIHITPAPTLMVMPTDETIKRNSKIRIDPMIEASPVLRERIAPARSRDSGNTLTQKEFSGGVLVLTGANSASGLRSMPIRFLFLDEVDAYPSDLEGEGSPIDLAMARTRTFANKKVFKISTPTIDGLSIIQKEFIGTDQRYFHVPCPHCGTLQHLIWEQMRWDKGKPETAQYECPHCNGMIEERHKPKMLASGEWIATVPQNANWRKVGYHINSLYSPLGWYSWADAVKDFEDAENDINKMKTFVNTVQGLTWKDKGDAPEWQNLYNKRETYELNKPHEDVVILTAGVDVQGDRLELEIVGWGAGKRSWSVDYRVLDGDTSKENVWRQLASVLDEFWVTPDGRELRISMMCVDSGFNTSHVYRFCVQQDSSRVIPIKGHDKAAVMVSAPRPVVINQAGKPIGAVKVWAVASSMIKSEVYGYLKLEREEDGSTPAGYCHFPQYDQFHFKSLTAEKVQIVKDKKGFDKHEWVKEFKRNERLDCRVYARAAAFVYGIDRWRDEDYEFMKGMNQEQETHEEEDNDILGGREFRL
jgi:phage terminase large subunit GpA-like protein